MKWRPVGKQSDLLQLSLKGESATRSEKIINTLIDVFNQDGITDRQLVSKRTLILLTADFDFWPRNWIPLRVDKKDFKQANEMVYLETDTELSIKQQSQAEEEVFRIENQLAIAQLVDEALRNDSGQ